MLASLAGVLAAGCGAKTGLEVPDSSMDAGPDASSDAGLDAPFPCIEIIPDGGVIELPLETEVQLGRADVVFLIDTTASMTQEIDEIRNRLRDTIAPGIRRAIPDADLGIATFGDFPVRPCGESSDRPFDLVLPVTDDIGRVQSAMESVTLGNGGDPAEAQVEALFQVATGFGLSPYIPPSSGCPAGGVGYPCFRTDAVPVVMLFTDAPFHNGPGGRNPYTSCPVGAVPHTYTQALDALDALGVRVMGLFSGTRDGIDDLRQIARDTGAVAGGDPIVFDIGTRGERLSAGVIQAIETLADVIEFDIDTVMVDVDPSDGVDPRDFVLEVRPVRADPMDGVREIDVAAGVFRGVRTGTTVVFELVLDPSAPPPPGPGPHRYLLEVVFRGDGRTRLDSIVVEIIFPGEGSCDGGSGIPTMTILR